MSPAVDYMPGLMATSMSGAYVATLVSATTMFSDGSSTDTAATGTDAWVVSIANAGDAAPPGPADVTVTAEKPWMPKHTHGSPTFPTVIMGDPGMFTESEMIIFQTGYWSVTLDLQPPSGAADKVTFAICIRQ